jgi:MEMO1 family protein
MIKFASICPHPPIIVPTIGNPSDLKQVSKTIESMNSLAQKLKTSEAETLLIISPHGPLDFNQFTIIDSPLLLGHFYNFGDFKTELIFKNDLEKIKLIEKECSLKDIPLRKIKEKELDHGSLVPLYFLSQKAPKIKVIPIGYSDMSTKEHFQFGKSIKEALRKEKVAVVASGDLSHILSKESPAGYSKRGKEFDEKLISFLEEKNIEEILNMDSILIEEAGQCAYNSIIILLGILNETEWKPEILSYQDPFGVGYLTANMKIKNQ